MQPPETEYVRRPDGVRIAYQVVGSGAIDLLFAPAFISHLDFLWTDPAFAQFIERLSSFARVILFDKPGTGLSDPVAFVPTLEERAEDIRRVLDAAGSARTTLFAFSDSGPTCVFLAAGNPERFPALVLGGTFARVPEPDAVEIPDDVRRRITEFWAARDEIAEHWGDGRSLKYFAPSIDTPLQRRFWGRVERAAATRSMLNGLFEFNRGLDVREVARNVMVPALVVHLSDDFIPAWSGRELSELIPNARFVEFPGADHALWFGDAETILDEVQEFLTGAPVPTSKRLLTTVLFTDIVDSTATAAELGDADWRALLKRHNALVEQLVVRAGGRVVKFTGDGTLCSFPGPVAAAECAAELLRVARARLGIALRAGIHTGECEAIGDDLAGIAIHIGARVSANAAPDEVLVSGIARELAAGSGLEFEERGAYDLKGVPGTWTLHTLSRENAASRTAVESPPDKMMIGDRAAVALARRAPRLLRALAHLSRR